MPGGQASGHLRGVQTLRPDLTSSNPSPGSTRFGRILGGMRVGLRSQGSPDAGSAAREGLAKEPAGTAELHEWRLAHLVSEVTTCH